MGITPSNSTSIVLTSVAVRPLESVAVNVICAGRACCVDLGHGCAVARRRDRELCDVALRDDMILERQGRGAELEKTRKMSMRRSWISRAPAPEPRGQAGDVAALRAFVGDDVGALRGRVHRAGLHLDDAHGADTSDTAGATISSCGRTGKSLEERELERSGARHRDFANHRRVGSLICHEATSSGGIGNRWVASLSLLSWN